MQFLCPSVRPSVCPWTQFCPELPLLNHSPFFDQNLLFDNALGGGGCCMVTFSDSSSIVTWLIFGMKAHFIDTYLLVPRSSAKVKVRYHISPEMPVLGGISVSQTHLVSLAKDTVPWQDEGTLLL